MAQESCPHCGALLKLCPRCERTLPADRFTKSKTSATGLSSWCRACQKTHRDAPERKARQSATNRAWRAGRQGQRSPAPQTDLERRLAALEAAIRKPAPRDE
jgi:hypothetical protein